MTTPAPLCADCGYLLSGSYADINGRLYCSMCVSRHSGPATAAPLVNVPTAPERPAEGERCGQGECVICDLPRGHKGAHQGNPRPPAEAPSGGPIALPVEVIHRPSAGGEWGLIEVRGSGTVWFTAPRRDILDQIAAALNRDVE